MTTTNEGAGAMEQNQAVHPIFQECCSNEYSNYSIDRWWVKDGYRIATDGRICVRAKTDEPDTVSDDYKLPPIHSIGWDRERQPQPLVFPSMVPMSTRMGCGECDGLGTWSCDCPDCTTKHDCEDCNKSGFYEEWGNITLVPGLVTLSEKYVALLMRHGCKAWSMADNSTTSPVYFTFDGGDGLVMPIRPQRTKEAE